MIEYFRSKKIYSICPEFDVADLSRFACYTETSLDSCVSKQICDK
jgi:hypothetical protein